MSPLNKAVDAFIDGAATKGVSLEMMMIGSAVILVVLVVIPNKKKPREEHAHKVIAPEAAKGGE